jgi:hypothetical protein
VPCVLKGTGQRHAVLFTRQNVGIEEAETMRERNSKRLKRVEKDLEEVEIAEVVRTLAKLAHHNATAARLLIEMRYGKPEEGRINFRLTIVDPGGKNEGA